MAEATGDEESAAIGRFSEMFSLLELARVAEADALLEPVGADVRRLRLSTLGWQLGWYRATRTLLAGDVDAAAAHAREARDGQLRSGQYGATYTYALHHLMAARLGATPDPEAVATQPSPLADALMAQAVGATPDEVRARLAAPVTTDEGGTPSDRFLVYVTCATVDLRHSLGVADGADALHAALLPWAGRLSIAGSASSCEGAVDHFLGLAADLMGDREAAERHLEAALALHRSIPAPLHAARTAAALAALR